MSSVRASRAARPQASSTPPPVLAGVLLINCGNRSYLDASLDVNRQINQVTAQLHAGTHPSASLQQTFSRKGLGAFDLNILSLGQRGDLHRLFHEARVDHPTAILLAPPPPRPERMRPDGRPMRGRPPINRNVAAPEQRSMPDNHPGSAALTGSEDQSEPRPAPLPERSAPSEGARQGRRRRPGLTARNSRVQRLPEPLLPPDHEPEFQPDTATLNAESAVTAALNAGHREGHLDLPAEQNAQAAAFLTRNFGRTLLLTHTPEMTRACQAALTRSWPDERHGQLHGRRPNLDARFVLSDLQTLNRHQDRLPVRHFDLVVVSGARTDPEEADLLWSLQARFVLWLGPLPTAAPPLDADPVPEARARRAELPLQDRQWEGEVPTSPRPPGLLAPPLQPGAGFGASPHTPMTESQARTLRKFGYQPGAAVTRAQAWALLGAHPASEAQLRLLALAGYDVDPQRCFWGALQARDLLDTLPRSGRTPT